MYWGEWNSCVEHCISAPVFNKLMILMVLTVMFLKKFFIWAHSIVIPPHILLLLFEVDWTDFFLTDI